jgi:hypothetical protein
VLLSRVRQRCSHRVKPVAESPVPVYWAPTAPGVVGVNEPLGAIFMNGDLGASIRPCLTGLEEVARVLRHSAGRIVACYARCTEPSVMSLPELLIVKLSVLIISIHSQLLHQVKGWKYE